MDSISWTKASPALSFLVSWRPEGIAERTRPRDVVPRQRAFAHRNWDQATTESLMFLGKLREVIKSRNAQCASKRLRRCDSETVLKEDNWERKAEHGETLGHSVDEAERQ